jgi:hypothetical protein
MHRLQYAVELHKWLAVRGAERESFKTRDIDASVKCACSRLFASQGSQCSIYIAFR